MPGPTQGFIQKLLAAAVSPGLPSGTLAASVNLTSQTAPSSPAGGFVLYVDSADSKLKAKSSGGTVTVLALP